MNIYHTKANWFVAILCAVSFSIASVNAYSLGGFFNSAKSYAPVITTKATVAKIHDQTVAGLSQLDKLHHSYALRGVLLLACVGFIVAQNAYWQRDKIGHAYRSIVDDTSDGTKNRA